MDLYVSNKAIEELNTEWRTAILFENGEKTGGYIEIENGKPEIYNLFGCGETIHLKRLFGYHDGKLSVDFVTRDVEQSFTFYVYHPEKSLVTEWNE